MSVSEIGISLPSVGAGGEIGGGEIAAMARHVERQELDAVSVADLLRGDGTPAVESIVAASAAAAATERVTVSLGTLALPLRPVAWVAAQAAALQQVSDNRLQLGVGIGGFPGGPFWQSAGGPPADQRARRTDEDLAVLPDLIAGRRTDLGGVLPPLTLAPATPVPPIYIGGTSGAALRRTIRFGDGWFPSLLAPAVLADKVTLLTELAHERDRTVPTVDYCTHAVFDADARQQLLRSLTGGHGLAPAEAAEIPLSGDAAQLAAQFVTYAEAGADRITVSVDGSDWYYHVEVIAAARELLG